MEQIFRSVKATNRTHRLCYVEDLLSADRAEKMLKAGVLNNEPITYDDAQ